MKLVYRAMMKAVPIGVAVTLFVGATATAQVAILSDAGPSPEPDMAVESEPQFADREEALLAYVGCLRENGLDVDDPVPGERGRGFLRNGPGEECGVDLRSEESQVAQAACGPILEASRPEIDPAAERLETQLLLAQCLRDNGYPEYPDPAVDGDGRLQRGAGRLSELGIDRRSDSFQTALETCAQALGVERFGRRGGPDAPGDDG